MRPAQDVVTAWRGPASLPKQRKFATTAFFPRVTNDLSFANFTAYHRSDRGRTAPLTPSESEHDPRLSRSPLMFFGSGLDICADKLPAPLDLRAVLFAKAAPTACHRRASFGRPYSHNCR